MPSLQHEVNTPFEKATFGMGCFWASDSLYGATPGVLRTKVGYSGGTKADPKYRDLGDHTEVIEIHFDPKIVSYNDLLELFWNNHEYGLTTVIKRQHEVNTPFEKATFGMGCFWASDSLYGATPGVLRTKVGYSGGTKADPKYRDLGDHTEVIEIHFDPKIVSYNDLLELFWNNHEYGLTTVIKRQYMSLILYHNDDQQLTAEKSMQDQADKMKDKLITEIKPAGPFYPAEDYHQKYRLQRHPWLCEMLQMKQPLWLTSHLAARLNGYVVGLGNKDFMLKELEGFGFTEKMIDYVHKEWKENEGGSLYC